MYQGLHMTRAAMAAQQQQQQRTAVMNGAYDTRPGGTPQQMMAVNPVRPQVSVQQQSAQFTSVTRNLLLGREKRDAHRVIRTGFLSMKKFLSIYTSVRSLAGR